MAKTLRGFEDLPIAELRRSAIEDFAVEAKETDNKATVLAALLEAGVTWDEYVAQHPEVAPEPPANVITAPVVKDEVVTPVVAPNVVTATAPVYQPNDVLLVKMERDNPRFDYRGNSFTQEHPYALLNPADATALFKNEEGFRPAYPQELQEFYG